MQCPEGNLLTYTVHSVDERVITAVAHGQPMAAKEDDVDVSVSEKINMKEMEFVANWKRLQNGRKACLGPFGKLASLCIEMGS